MHSPTKRYNSHSYRSAMSKAKVPALLALAISPIGLGLMAAQPVHAATSVTLTPVMTGLNNPRHMTFSADGTLYVAEAGTGGGPGGISFIGSDGTTQYYGATGSVSRLRKGRQVRIDIGLPSSAAVDGSEATGPTDILDDGGFYVLMGGLEPATRASLAAQAPLAQDFDQLLQVTHAGADTWTPVADFLKYEVAHNPDGADVNSDPYSITPYPFASKPPVAPSPTQTVPRVVVADAGADDIMEINGANNGLHLVAVLPSQLVAGPGGSTIPMEAVPTCLVVNSKGTIYAGQLTGFPFPPGGASIWEITGGHAPQLVIGGFTNIVSMAYAPNGDLYVVDLTTNGLASPTGPGSGALYKVTLGKTPTKTLVTDDLSFPTAVAIWKDGTIYVTNNGVTAGIGEVERVGSSI